MILMKEIGGNPKEIFGYFVARVMGKYDKETIPFAPRVSPFKSEKEAQKWLTANRKHGEYALFKLLYDGTQIPVWASSYSEPMFRTNSWFEVKPISRIKPFPTKNGLPIIPKKIIIGIQQMRFSEAGKPDSGKWAFYRRASSKVWELNFEKEERGYTLDEVLLFMNLEGQLETLRPDSIERAFSIPAKKFLDFFIYTTGVTLAPNFKIFNKNIF